MSEPWLPAAPSLNVERPAWWLLSVCAIGLCAALGITRRRLAGQGGYPIASVIALGLGLLGPDWVASRFGCDSHLNMIAHSLVLPFLLLSELEGRAALRWVALLSAALTAHLVWDLRWGTAPFPAIADWQATLWLWANTVAGAVITLSALLRSRHSSGDADQSRRWAGRLERSPAKDNAFCGSAARARHSRKRRCRFLFLHSAGLAHGRQVNRRAHGWGGCCCSRIP